MTKKSAASKASAAAPAAPKTGTGAFWLLGRVVVRAPWLVIAAWAAVVAVLAVAFPPLTKVVEGQTATAAAGEGHGGGRADGQGFR